MSDESVTFARLDLAIERVGKRIAELEAEKARALDRLDEMYLARTELEKKQITLLSNYGRLEAALRDAEKASAKIIEHCGMENPNFGNFTKLNFAARLGLIDIKANESLTAIRAALHGEGK